MVKNILVPMLSTLRHCFILVVMLECGYSIVGWLLQVFICLKCVTNNTLRNICYIREVHSITSLILLKSFHLMNFICVFDIIIP